MAAATVTQARSHVTNGGPIAASSATCAQRSIWRLLPAFALDHQIYIPHGDIGTAGDRPNLHNPLPLALLGSSTRLFIGQPPQRQAVWQSTHDKCFLSSTSAAAVRITLTASSQSLGSYDPSSPILKFSSNSALIPASICAFVGFGHLSTILSALAPSLCAAPAVRQTLDP